MLCFLPLLLVILPVYYMLLERIISSKFLPLLETSHVAGLYKSNNEYSQWNVVNEYFLFHSPLKKLIAKFSEAIKFTLEISCKKITASSRLPAIDCNRGKEKQIDMVDCIFLLSRRLSLFQNMNRLRGILRKWNFFNFLFFFQKVLFFNIFPAISIHLWAILKHEVLHFLE